MIAILHEGNAKKTADNALLKLLLGNLSLNEKEVEFYGFGSKSNFFNINNEKYKVLCTEVKEENISKILFVTDADYEKNDSKYGGYTNTKTQLNHIIQELNLVNISDIYITCDPSTKEGYLESLILSTIPAEKKECIDNFLNCSDFKFKDNHKAILNSFYYLAYPEKPFDLSHENFNILKTKLKQLFT